MSNSDAESILIPQAVAGDRTALAQLLLLHHDSLERYIRQLLTSEPNRVSHWDDILQQTFVRAAGSIAGFESRPGVSFRAWLKTIAANLVHDAGRRHRLERRAGRSVESGGVLDDESIALIIDRCAAEVTPPARRAQRDDNMRRLREALTNLPDDQREILVRFYLHEQTWEQIAEATGRSKEAVRGICYRARQNLRGVLGRSSLYFSN